MSKLSKISLSGFNITVPYKQTVIPYLNALTPEARAVGAVNTVYQKGGRWVGTNTDIHGFVRSVIEEGKFNPAGKYALVFGAGGAARAVIYGLAQQKIKTICIVNRHGDKAESLMRAFEKQFPKVEFLALDFRGKSLEKTVQNADLIVNATTLGLKSKDPSVLPAALIPRAKQGRQKLFVDLIYHRSATSFLKAAENKGHRILNGMGMLLFQGAKAFECWTGRKAPVAIMRKTLMEGLRP